MIYGAMYPLEQGRWVMRLDDASRENQHFAQWVINPALAVQFKDHRAEVIRAKQRQLDDIYRLSKTSTVADKSADTKSKAKIPYIYLL
jgi:hypothetical protein